MSTENNTQTDTEILLGLVTQLSTHDTDIKSAIQGVNDVTASMKALIAPAITAKGVPTSETDSAQTMADNIGLIKTEAIVYLGSDSEFNLKTFDNGKYSEQCSNFTADNFIVEYASGSSAATVVGPATGYSSNIIYR